MLRRSFAFLSSNLFACPLMTPIIIRLIFRSIHLIFTQCTEWHFYWKYWMYRTHFVVRGASVNRYMCSGDFKQTNHQILPYLTENRHFNLNVYIAFHCQNLSLSLSASLSLSYISEFLYFGNHEGLFYETGIFNYFYELLNTCIKDIECCVNLSWENQHNI